MEGIFSAFGLSASAGMNAYIPLLAVSLVAKFTDLITLDEPWSALTSWWIIGLLIVLLAIEFFADKVPAVNHINDIIHTFIRPVAGAIVFAASAQSITEIHPVLSLGAGLLVAGGVHVAKSAVIRPAVTATTAGTGHAVVSFIEDVVSTIISILAIVLPILLGVLLILFIFWLIWYLVRRKRQKLAAASGQNRPG
jgi:hypothetical protein